MSEPTIAKERNHMAERSLTPVQADAGQIMEQVITKGDLKELTPAQRARYYTEVCQSIGLNALTKPFDYITLNGKLTLYATKGATDQLRGLRSVSVWIESREQVDDLYIVTAAAQTPDGRRDSDIGAVNIKGLAGENLANAMMKATTKAKRRVTLSLCGLGWLDESEVDSIPNVGRPVVDIATGEIQDDDKTRVAVVQALGSGKRSPKKDVVDYDNMTDQDYAHRVGDALASKNGTAYTDLVAAAGEQEGRWHVLIDNADSLKALDWIRSQYEKSGAISPELDGHLDGQRERLGA